MHIFRERGTLSVGNEDRQFTGSLGSQQTTRWAEHVDFVA